jgi:choline dehydrogenase-like flavoprotein
VSERRCGRLQRAQDVLSPRERKALRSFAQALLPPEGKLPGAEVAGGAPIVESVSSLVQQAPPRTRLAVRLALQLFSNQLSLSQRGLRAQKRLVRADRSRFALRRDSFQLLKALVCVAYARDGRVGSTVGVTEACRLADTVEDLAPQPTPAPRLRRQQLVASEAREDCDVVVVGSGAGGAAAARVMAEAGLDVIVVEQGGYYDASSYSTDPLHAIETLYREAGLTVSEGLPAIPVPVGRCVGGTTVINSGTCLRPPSEVLEHWRERFGIGWATELDREFSALEQALAVCPVDPSRAGRNASLCRDGSQKLGFSNGPLPRNAGSVTCCGSCPMGCRLDAKQAMHVSELPKAVAAGARVRANQQVHRVLTERGRACGVMCEGYEVRGRAVVLAAGALGTPELLLGQGYRTQSDLLGHKLRIHPACWVGASFEQPVLGWEGVMQSWLVDEFQDQGLFLEATATPLAFGAQFMPGAGYEFKRRIERYGHLAVIGVHLSEHSEGRVKVQNGRMRARYRLGTDDGKKLRYGIARAAEIHAAAGAFEIYPQLGGIGVLGPNELERIEQGRFTPRQLRLEGFHPMGTARMAADPRAGVVNPDGEAHDLAGLYITDASILPGSPRVNPMLTIMACARHIASGLAQRLR